MARLVYFMELVDKLGRGTEEVTLPAPKMQLEAFLDWLQSRGEPWAIIADYRGRLNVTVNKQFAMETTTVRQEDEIALIPLCK